MGQPSEVQALLACFNLRMALTLFGFPAGGATSSARKGSRTFYSPYSNF